MTAALVYAGMGWPVIPGAVWRNGKFVDPASGEPADKIVLRPIDTATIGETRAMWLVTPEDSR
ncbi:hypothetical protein GCM10009634_06370 [Saccharothrix xinjiangensis]